MTITIITSNIEYTGKVLLKNDINFTISYIHMNMDEPVYEFILNSNTPCVKLMAVIDILGPGDFDQDLLTFTLDI